MSHTHLHAALRLQQGLDLIARCAGMLQVIGFQPSADRATLFGAMALTPLAHAVLPVCQHPLPQPVRGRPAHLEPCRLYCFAP